MADHHDSDDNEYDDDPFGNEPFEYEPDHHDSDDSDDNEYEPFENEPDHHDRVDNIQYEPFENEPDHHDSDDSEYWPFENEPDHHDSDDNEYEPFENEPYYSDPEENITNEQEKRFTQLNEANILQRQEDDITNVSTVLSISKVDAGLLLQHYHWSVNDVREAWFDDEQKVRKTVGLMEGRVIQSPGPNTKDAQCRLCFEDFHHYEICSANCGHPFCRACWKDYINYSIYIGPECLTLTCPDFYCGAAVDQGMVNELANDEDKEKYARYVTKSYVDESPKRKWCPLRCQSAVEFVLGSGNYDVKCVCSHDFCWNCSAEAHHPVDCDTVSKWILKNNTLFKTFSWRYLIVYDKSCPKCQRSMEIDRRCSHMTCPHPCNYQFCWLCLCDWSSHEITAGTNHIYKCNLYEAEKGAGKSNEEENKDENSLERYNHYSERWASNKMYRNNALDVLGKLWGVQYKFSGKRFSRINFIITVWIKIVECRLVLQWSYAYGYFLSDLDESKKTFFEYQQGQAESCLESLHSCAEENIAFLKTYEEDGSLPNFIDFDQNLDALTRVTKDHFEKLVQVLKNVRS